MKRLSLATLGTTALVLGSIAAASGASAAPGGGECQLHGTATFTPNGPGTAATFGYGFSGALSNCQSSIANAPTSGNISAGQTFTTTLTDGSKATYAEPAASGTGSVPGNSCAAGSTSGTSIVTWADGSTTVISYTTDSAAAAVHLTGTVIKSVTLKLASGNSSAPATLTVSSTSAAFPVGDGAQGALAFEVTTPTACNTAAGVSSAGIDGVVGVGATS